MASSISRSRAKRSSSLIAASWKHKREIGEKRDQKIIEQKEVDNSKMIDPAAQPYLGFQQAFLLAHEHVFPTLTLNVQLRAQIL